MTLRDDRMRLLHMLDHAAEALDMAHGKTRNDLDSDRRLNLSLVRLFEIVGEAAARVSKDTRERYPNIPWPDIVGLRNRLIHGYDQIDFDILWEVIETDLPQLVAQLRQILEEEL